MAFRYGSNPSGSTDHMQDECDLTLGEVQRILPRSYSPKRSRPDGDETLRESADICLDGYAITDHGLATFIRS